MAQSSSEDSMIVAQVILTLEPGCGRQMDGWSDRRSDGIYHS